MHHDFRRLLITRSSQIEVARHLFESRSYVAQNYRDKGVEGRFGCANVEGRQGGGRTVRTAPGCGAGGGLYIRAGWFLASARSDLVSLRHGERDAIEKKNGTDSRKILGENENGGEGVRKGMARLVEQNDGSSQVKGVSSAADEARKHASFSRSSGREERHALGFLFRVQPSCRVTRLLDSVPTGCALAISGVNVALADWARPTSPPDADDLRRQCSSDRLDLLYAIC
ncbi:hypothetical protein HPB51_010432 [Rhipicephalus microplus]|uniref:Uncharacterized protein n=1 Tax=Rhipicephalus microplus TaxID=6941 RepID=A0A9J6E8Q0_RHIMP|nr:hypothetical protein HPB51_010432 [Rhipicephalus microplus]